MPLVQVTFLDVLSGLQELAVEAVENVFEPVAARMGEYLAVLTVHLGVDDDVAAGFVIVAIVVRRVLVIPFDLAVGGIEGDRARCVKIVAEAIARIIGRHRIARAPIGEVGGGIIGTRNVEGAAAGLPGIVLFFQVSLPGSPGPGSNRSSIACRRSSDRARRPSCAGRVAAGAADHDRILQGERCCRQFEVRLIEQVLVPDDPAGLLVGSDDPACIAGHRDHEIVPQGGAAIAVLFLQHRVHLPHHRAGGAGAHVDLGDDAPTVDHVHEAVFDQGRRFEAFIGRGAAERRPRTRV